MAAGAAVALAVPAAHAAARSGPISTDLAAVGAQVSADRVRLAYMPLRGASA